MTAEDIREMLNYISRYSLYAYQEKLRQGFVTIEGGHRIGVAGNVIYRDGGVQGISPVTFLNIRLAHERKGCGKEVLSRLYCGDTVGHTLFFSEPGAGKTTLLRDCIRLLSEGNGEVRGKKVGIVDERSELAACHMGVPQNDIGPRTDVLDGCPKAEGIRLLLRSMSPEVIAVDEMGPREDYEAVREAAFCGCAVLATIHAGSPEELKKNPGMREMLRMGLFERYILVKREKNGQRNMYFYGSELERLC